MDDRPHNADEQAFWDNAFVTCLNTAIDVDVLGGADVDAMILVASNLASKALIERRKKAIT